MVNGSWVEGPDILPTNINEHCMPDILPIIIYDQCRAEILHTTIYGHWRLDILPTIIYDDTVGQRYYLLSYMMTVWARYTTYYHI